MIRSGGEGPRATPAPSSSNAISGENVEPNDVESEDVLEIMYEPGSHGNRGTIRFTDGDVYEGELKDGEPHGRGSCRFSKNDRGLRYVYDGEWKHGWMHGTGVFKWTDGRCYDGEYREGKKQGKGTMTFASGSVYVGDHEQGLKHGRGTYTWANGTVYVGEWKDDIKHGTGIMTCVDGNVYRGGFENDKRHGKGTFTWKDGDVYEGEWMDDEKHGWGKMTYPSGSAYEGEWRKGKEHGKGTFTYASGKVYKGEFKDGMRHGKGTTIYPSGRIYEGHWADGKRVYSDERTLRSPHSQEQRLQKNVTTKHCEHCGVDDFRYKLRVCSGCNLALYCSAACQKAARGSHQRICDIISQLPSRDGDRLVLEFNRDKLVDLNAGLYYAKKYMDNLKHLQINLQMMEEDDTIKLSPKRLSSIFREGELESVSCSSSDIFKVGFTGIGNAVWIFLHGLKQLRLECMRLGDVRIVCDTVFQQRDTLMVLCLPCTDIDWSKAKCRRSIAQAVSSCKHLVALDLRGCVLMDSELKFMLQNLPNLRCLDLARDADHNYEFTDNTCGLIARKCPGLQELNLSNHEHLSVRGIRKIFEGCTHLRSFYISTRKLSCKDMRSLLATTAPQLMCLSLGNRIDAVTDEVVSDIIESTGGRIVFQLWNNDSPFDPNNISAETREKYEHQTRLLRQIWSRREDPEVANVWADMLEE